MLYKLKKKKFLFRIFKKIFFFIIIFIKKKKKKKKKISQMNDISDLKRKFSMLSLEN